MNKLILNLILILSNSSIKQINCAANEEQIRSEAIDKIMQTLLNLNEPHGGIGRLIAQYQEKTKVERLEEELEKSGFLIPVIDDFDTVENFLNHGINTEIPAFGKLIDNAIKLNKTSMVKILLDLGATPPPFDQIMTFPIRRLKDTKLWH